MRKLFRSNRPPPSVETRPPRGTGDTQGAKSSATQSSPRIVLAQDPDPSESTFVERCLLNYNLERAGPHHYRKVAAFLRDPANQVLGGITGRTYWGWLMIEFLWVPEELRAKGYGKQLLTTVETDAANSGCHHASLDTFTFQGAVDFYKRCGYTPLGSLPSFPFGHERLYFYKALAS
jgi:GNAT superfamily N-acetyltransferase